jgi:SAM-dependent methyltransferase
VRRIDRICDLCGGAAWYRAARATPEHHAAVVCKGCGMICADPMVSQTELDKIYESFEVSREGIGGAADAATRAILLNDEAKIAQEWALPHIKRVVEIQGKRVLDLRCRTGAMSKLMEEAGAEVYGVEPFQANVGYGQNERGLNRVHWLPFSSFHKLNLPWPCQFDLAVSLTDHILGHAMSPRILLLRLFDVLKPGGYLIFEEKDVLQPRHWHKKSVLASGKAHLYHFTVDSTARYVKSAGFEVQEYAVDKARLSNFHHFVTVARKPKQAGRAVFSLAPAQGRNAEEVLSELKTRERGVKVARLKQQTRETVIKVGTQIGARRIWRYMRGTTAVVGVL